jgi:egghead protein (zeste-white 4 protein)
MFLFVTIVFLAAFGSIFAVQEFVWGDLPITRLQDVLVFLTITWALPLPNAVPGLVGLYLYRLKRPPPQQPALDELVCFRIISRGDNVDTLLGTIMSIRVEMRERPLFRHCVEVVTDLAVDLGDSEELTHFLIPPSYRPPDGSRFKARALRYAMEHSDLPDEAWIMHLDEESHLTPSVVAGIRTAVAAEEGSGRHRIGQGMVLYHRTLESHPVLTLADSIRTGDDAGRFHFQHRLGVTLFGLHGSFILVRNSVEKAVGFDVGPAGSITEDAFWAMLAMDKGYRCRWVDGYLVEQSPQSVWDFLEQRRRWFQGLILVVRHAQVAVRYRLTLGLTVALWAVSWVGILYVFVNLLVGVTAWLPFRIVGDATWAFYVVTYLVGLKLNLDDCPEVGWAHRLGYYAAQVLLIPVFALLEGVAVLYAIVEPEPYFYVIQK